jgi:hypothetical protein
MPEVFLTCSRCGKESEDVTLCYDPYEDEINHKKIETNLCDKCFQEKVRDI